MGGGLAREYSELVCGLNLHLLRGMTDGAGAAVSAGWVAGAGRLPPEVGRERSGPPDGSPLLVVPRTVSR